MARYRIKTQSPTVYVVDTDKQLYWPEQHPPEAQPPAPLMATMNPESETFRGALLETIREDGDFEDPAPEATHTKDQEKSK